jgi:hypothetical protein
VNVGNDFICCRWPLRFDDCINGTINIADGLPWNNDILLVESLIFVAVVCSLVAVDAVIAVYFAADVVCVVVFECLLQLEHGFRLLFESFADVGDASDADVVVVVVVIVYG